MIEATLLNINGMTNYHSVRTIQVKLNNLEGVRHAKVSLQDEKALIIYDTNEINVGQLIDMIREHGYEVI